jgi:hypothetical protein
MSASGKDFKQRHGAEDRQYPINASRSTTPKRSSQVGDVAAIFRAERIWDVVASAAEHGTTRMDGV